jgi:hypothetical protein
MVAVSRNIRSIWITDYDKAIGDVTGYLDSGSGYSPIEGTFSGRSTVTGVKEITVDGYFWGSSIGDVTYAAPIAELDEDLTAGETTVTLDTNVDFNATTADPGYILIEDEIIKYTGNADGTDLTGCVRAQFDTTDVQHDGTAGTIYVYNWLRGVIQSLDYEPEDEVYAIRVALPSLITGGGVLLPQVIAEYFIYRFEFPKHVVDLVLYTDTENPTTISGTTPGYLPE